MAGTFVIEVGKTGRYRFNLKAGNSQIILSSEQYESKAAAKDGIEAVRKNAADDGSFVRKAAKDGSAYFVIKARNGEILGKNEMYSSKSGMENGIKSVATNAPTAKVVDRSS